MALRLGDGLNTLVGPNNCGKSNVFRALAVALDPDFRFDRSRDMPTAKMWAKPTITLTFALPPKGRAPSEVTLLKYLDEYERLANAGVKSTFASEGTIKLRVTIEGGEDSIGSRRETFVSSGAGGRSLPSDHEVAVKALAQFHKCFHFVLIHSGQSLESLLEGKFRDILQNVLKDDLARQFSEATESRDRFVSDLQQGLLRPLTDRIQRELRELFPEITKVSLRPDVRDLEETLAQMSVDVTDLALTDLADKGTGVRGGLLIAMLRHFAETGRRSMLFAIEEPEAFLHPAAQESLREDLEQLAKKNTVSLLVTSHSPYIVSRLPEAKTFALDKDERGRTVMVSEAHGGEARSGVLGGLYRNRLLLDVLDRAAAIPAGARGVLVVEGSTDEDYIRLAVERVGRGDLLGDLGIVQAGAGVPGSNAGGAALAVMQALIVQATAGVAVAALFDDDDEGKEGQATLRVIGRKTGHWKKGKSLFGYGETFDPSASFAFEAEDLWPNELFESFLAEHGETGVLKCKQERPKTVGGWQYDLAPAVKGRFVEFLRDHVKPEQCGAWLELISKIRAGLRLPASSNTETQPSAPTAMDVAQTAEQTREAAKPVGDSRRGGLWPLPGGRKAWKQTLDAMVRYLTDRGTVSIDEAAQWLESRHSRVRSHRLAVDYWLVPGAIGLVERSGGKLTITAAGGEYGKGYRMERLGELLLANVWGTREVLDYLEENEASTDELLDLLRQLGVKWKTDDQVVYRLRWLELCGLVELKAGSWRGRHGPPS